MEKKSTEAQKYVWDGAIPLQVHLHDSEVTTLPTPPPALILAPRLGYLPLLVAQIKPYFSSALPPGADTVWFEYRGLPLKWHIPTGVLYDLLCAEPERPWNLTVHFRNYPKTILTPCEGEDSVKWSFINSLKEAACIINGNCKNVMNMSQSDQTELWRSVLNGNLESYSRVALKLKFGFSGDDVSLKLNTSSSKSQEASNDPDVSTPKEASKGGRIPIRLYLRTSSEDFDDLENVPLVERWDDISYLNRPVEMNDNVTGKCFTLGDAIKGLLPEFFPCKSSHKESACLADETLHEKPAQEESGDTRGVDETLHEQMESCSLSEAPAAEMKLVRIQGIEPKLEIPFAWVVNNLMNPEHFIHISVYVRVQAPPSA